MTAVLFFKTKKKQETTSQEKKTSQGISEGTSGRFLQVHLIDYLYYRDFQSVFTVFLFGFTEKKSMEEILQKIQKKYLEYNFRRKKKKKEFKNKSLFEFLLKSLKKFLKLFLEE